MRRLATFSKSIAKAESSRPKGPGLNVIAEREKCGACLSDEEPAATGYSKSGQIIASSNDVTLN